MAPEARILPVPIYKQVNRLRAVGYSDQRHSKDVGGHDVGPRAYAVPRLSHSRCNLSHQRGGGWLRATEVQVLNVETVSHSQETALHPLLPGLELLEGGFPGVTTPVTLHGTQNPQLPVKRDASWGMKGKAREMDHLSHSPSIPGKLEM